MGQDLLGPFDVDESVHGVQGLRGGDERAVLGATDDRLERVQQRVGVGRTPLVHERVGEQDSTGDRGCVVERHAGELLGQRVGTASVSGLGGLDRERGRHRCARGVAGQRHAQRVVAASHAPPLDALGDHERPLPASCRAHGRLDRVAEEG